MKRTKTSLLVLAVLLAAAALVFVVLRGDRDSTAPASPSLTGSPRLALQGGRTWDEIDDPAGDGWSTEVFSAAATRRLDALGSLAVALASGAETGGAADLVTGDFTSAALRPSLREVSSGALFRVLRAEPGATAASRPMVRGPGRLLAALADLVRPFQGGELERVAFKVFGVARDADVVTTRQHVSLVGRTGDAMIEQNATWTARWASGGAGVAGVAGVAPRLLSIAVEAFEEASTVGSSRPLLEDAAAAVLGSNASWREQLLLGFNHWLERIQDTRYFALFGCPGIAVGDVDGDGLDDLYVCQEGGLPNLLFIQNPDGTARDVSAASGADWLESARAALLVDLDNDGDRDLAVTVFGSLVLAANDGRGRFTVRQALTTPHDTFTLTAADFDDDADLDLYVCGYNSNDLTDDSGVVSIGGGDGRFVYHDANNGAPNILFRNDLPRDSATGGGVAEWTFTDVTDEVGLGVNNRRFSYAAAWEDFDNDGDQDLYVANDFGRNNLYRNEGGRFVDVAARAAAEDSASGMGVTWADYDRDGWMDVAIGNMFSAAGSRITTQERFKPQSSETVRTRLQRFARGNTLLRNLGDGSFADVSEGAGVTMARWAWSTNFADLDCDGLEDLVVANGYITTEDTGDL